jgi:protein SCO1/2
MTLVAGVVACGAVMVRKEFKGDLLEPPLPKPEFVLPAMDGTMFDFRKETDGDIALLFFGFTHCPDICPVHMTNIAAARKTLSESDARRIHVVFVTTDPARDTPERMREWLGAIDPRIIGIIPSVTEGIRLQSELGIQPAVVHDPKTGHEGNYSVSHAAQVIAFTTDNKGRLAYPFGVRQSDWASDLPRMLRARWPAAEE